MLPEKCVTTVDFAKVLVKEGGKKAIFLNVTRSTFQVTRFDGCVVHNVLAADWVVSKRNVGDVVIELKGRDVHHAVKQVRATAEYWRNAKLCNGQMSGLIVARQYPRETTSVQRAKISFARDFRGPLHVVTKNYEYQIEHVLSFKGPHCGSE